MAAAENRSQKSSDVKPDPLVYIEEWIADDLGAETGTWMRMPRFGVALHPAHGKAVLADLKRDKSRKFRLVEF